MRLTITILLISIALGSCKSGEKIPDVSAIKINITTERFDKDLFALDTANFASGYQKLREKYPDFSGFFSGEILGLDPKWTTDSTIKYISDFTHSYRAVYDTAALIFDDFSKYENDIRQSLQFLKYYFPNYHAPAKVITYVGPLDGYGDIFFSNEAFVIGLQLHLGKNYSQYKTSFVSETY